MRHRKRARCSNAANQPSQALGNVSGLACNLSVSRSFIWVVPHVKAQADSLTMDTAVQDYFRHVLSRVAGLQAVLVTDRDGVVLIRAVRPECEELVTDSSFEATFALASEQAGKLRLGKNKSITCFYNNHTVVHINYLPVILSLIATPDANVGLIHGIVPEVKAALETIRSAIAIED